MIDFNIRRGLSSVLFSEPGVVNPRLVIEEGCWYLCTDTAELFLGVSTKDGLALKRINDSAKNPADEPTTGEGELVGGIIGAYINDTGELVVLFADNTEEVLGKVVGKDGQDGKDGLTTAVKVNGIVYNHENGIITLPDFITEHQDLSEYAKKTDIPEAEIYKVDFKAPDFAAAFEAYKNGKLLLLVNAAPDENSYAVMNYVREDKITFTKFLMSRSETYGAFNTYYLSPDNTWEVSKEVKLNKVEITEDGKLQVGKQVFEVPSVDGLATETFVHEMIAKAELADKEADLEAYYTKDQVDALIPSLNGYAKVEDIPTDYVKAADLEGYSKFSGSYNDLTDKPEIPSIDGLASEEFVRTEIGKIELPETDLTGYYTKEEVDTKFENIEHPTVDLSEYAKKDELFSGNYEDLTNKPVIPEAYDDSEIRGLIDGKADAEHTHNYLTEIPEEYITTTELQEAINGIEIPEIDLSGYYTKTEVDTKLEAADIPFKIDKFVKKAFGGFAVGDNLNGLTVADLFAKLLELSEVNPNEPEQPGELGDVTIEEVKQYSIPVMQGAIKDGEITIDDDISTFDSIELTEATAKNAPQAAEPGTAVLYEIKDSAGQVIEAGYQVYTISSGRGTNYRIALAEGLTIARVEMFDDGLTNSWVDYTPTFTDTGKRIEADNGYTYIVYQSSDKSDEEVLRFIIE